MKIAYYIRKGEFKYFDFTENLLEDFKKKYSAMYSPVPGGVGPLTVANLLKNTCKLAHIVD